MLKKILALAIAGAMVIGSMSMMAFAAAPEGLTADSTVTISGLDDDDTVNLYKVIEWNEGDAATMAGWVLTAPFANDTACQAVLTAINAVTDGVYSLTEADVKAFTDVIKSGSANAVKISGGAVSGGKSETTVDPGMYVALVKPKNTDTMYNPIVVSADYKAENNTNIMGSEVPLSEALVGNAEATVKKETTKVEKTQDDPQDTTDNSYDVGDTVNFTVKTTIPTFADAYVNPSFVVTDTMSDGLKLTTKTIHVYEEDGTTEITAWQYGENTSDAVASTIVEDGTKGWTLTVPTGYLKDLVAPQTIIVKFDAVLTESAFTSPSTEETNDVKVEFSNNPDNDQDKGTVKDRTRTYTFSIDGSLLGNSGVQTSELVKVALDGNGDPIFQSSATGATYTNALAGAIFGLFPTESAANAYTGNGKDITSKEAGAAAGMYTNANFNGVVTTDKDGYMQINGLDEGTYFLKELSAPDGFIKDQKVHTIQITAFYGTETVTENGYTFDLPVLDTVIITIDNAETTTYSMTLDASEIAISEATILPTSIKNVKGIELPSTGGIGTTIFYAGGAVLVLLAGVLLVSKRRIA